MMFPRQQAVTVLRPANVVEQNRNHTIILLSLSLFINDTRASLEGFRAGTTGTLLSGHRGYALERNTALLAHFRPQNSTQLGLAVSGIQPPLTVLVVLEPHRSAEDRTHQKEEKCERVKFAERRELLMRTEYEKGLATILRPTDTACRPANPWRCIGISTLVALWSLRKPTSHGFGAPPSIMNVRFTACKNTTS